MSPTASPVVVRVFHNVTAALTGVIPFGAECEYADWDNVVQVFATTVADGADDLAVCEEIFRLLNVGDDPDFGTPDPRAVRYRRRGNRSLSVGDLVQVGDAWYACARNGFTPITITPRAITTAVAGTTTYDGIDQLQAATSPAMA